MVRVHLDFETRSEVSVTDVGAWVYSKHPTTEILCAAFAIDDGPVQRLTSQSFGKHAYGREGIPIAELQLFRLSMDQTVTFVAHSAFFEQCIWMNQLVPRGLPTIPIPRWRCTAAKAANMGLPRSLAGAGEALGLPIQKDDKGQAVMQRLSRPRNLKNLDQGFLEEDDYPELFEQLYDYNATDVEAERCLDNALPDLSEREQQLWYLDQEINFRGVTVDTEAVKTMMAVIEQYTTELGERFWEATDGALNSPNQLVKFTQYLRDQFGLSLPNMQAATVRNMLKKDVPDTVRTLLQLRQEMSRASVAKYKAFLKRVDPIDHRLRDIFLYCAAITKRWGGRGVQLQNLPRGKTDGHAAISIAQGGGYAFFRDSYKDPMEACSSALRGMLTGAPRCQLLAADFSAIEARVLAWLAQEESSLEVFRSGKDPYLHAATRIYGVECTKSNKTERLVGKVSVLSLGYNGGIGACGTMARGYGVDLQPAYAGLWPGATEDERHKARIAYAAYLRRCEQDEEAEPLDRASGYAADIIKQRWRLANPNVVQYWKEIENAAIEAVLTGEKRVAGPPLNSIVFGTCGQFLLCRLPSGGCLAYPFPRVSQRETPWGSVSYVLSYMTEDSQSHQFTRTYTYGGKLVENITQAVARDLLAEAMLRVKDEGFQIVMHVHDEIVAEVTETSDSKDSYAQIISQVPDWAAGLPVEVEVWQGKRYKK